MAKHAYSVTATVNGQDASVKPQCCALYTSFRFAALLYMLTAAGMQQHKDQEELHASAATCNQWLNCYTRMDMNNCYRPLRVCNRGA